MLKKFVADTVIGLELKVSTVLQCKRLDDARCSDS